MGVTEVRTGEVWLATLDPTVGHEQGGRRPVVIVSSTGFNSAIDAVRLERRLGRVTPDELSEIRKVLRYFLDL